MLLLKFPRRFEKGEVLDSKLNNFETMLLVAIGSNT